jgi:Spy/CpxP family protein refolding chaperone
MNRSTDWIRRAVLLAGFVSIALVPLFAQGGSGAPRGPLGPPAGRGQFGPPPGPGLALERLDQELALTDAQKAQIRTLLTEQRTALKGTFESLRQAELQLDAAITEIPPDNGLIQVQVAAVTTIQTQLLMARATTESKIYQMLTPAQQQKAQEWIARMQQKTRPSAH